MRWSIVDGESTGVRRFHTLLRPATSRSSISRLHTAHSSSQSLMRASRRLSTLHSVAGLSISTSSTIALHGSLAAAAKLGHGHDGVCTSPRPDPDISFYPEHAIGVVNLALFTDTPSMLPLALYECAYLDSTLLFDG